MFTCINDQYDLFFSYSIKCITNIYHSAYDINLEYKSTVIGYLDDTTWIANTLPQLQTSSITKNTK